MELLDRDLASRPVRFGEGFFPAAFSMLAGKGRTARPFEEKLDEGVTIIMSDSRASG